MKKLSFLVMLTLIIISTACFAQAQKKAKLIETKGNISLFKKEGEYFLRNIGRDSVQITLINEDHKAVETLPNGLIAVQKSGGDESHQKIEFILKGGETTILTYKKCYHTKGILVGNDQVIWCNFPW